MVALAGAPRSGRPVTDTQEAVGAVIATALSDPQRRGLPCGSWTLDRLEAYRNETAGLAIERSRIDERLRAAGLRWRQAETWFGARVDPRFAEPRGRARPSPPPPRQRRDRPRRGGAKGGQELPRAARGPPHAHGWPAGAAGRAGDRLRSAGERRQLRRLPPVPGEALTPPLRSAARPTGPPSWSASRDGCRLRPGRVYASVANLNAHRATAVLLFSLGQPRWAVVFQPTCAAYRTLIEPWWKTRRAPAFQGRRVACWAEPCQAVERATAYRNAQRHPCAWGRRRRHRPCRRPGVALAANVR